MLRNLKTGPSFYNFLIRMITLILQVIIKKDEVEHTMTENRVLQSTRHPFLIVSDSAAASSMYFRIPKTYSS